MLDFDRDVIDPIERTWKSDICKRFPEYARFWNKWIGTRLGSESLDLEGYELSFSPQSSQEDQAGVMRRYEKIRASHYVVFFNLAQVHLSLQRLIGCFKALSGECKGVDAEEATAEASFMIASCWRFLGDAINMLDSLVTSILRINSGIKPRESGAEWLKKKLEGQDGFLRQYEDLFEKHIRRFRDLYTHHPPHPVAIDKDGRWLVPKNPPADREDLTWSEQVERMKEKEKIEVTQCISESLEATESLFNTIWPTLSAELEVRTRSLGISPKRIDSSDVKKEKIIHVKSSGSSAVADRVTGSTTHSITTIGQVTKNNCPEK
ncbi:MAG: hypothetical protein L6435_00665 [Anaerolineae bacterium]|nr:hypothetical protein [Anaerolineae bacterium]